MLEVTVEIVSDVLEVSVELPLLGTIFTGIRDTIDGNGTTILEESL